MFGSIGIPELLLIFFVFGLTLAPIVLLVLALVWAYRRVQALSAGQDDIRRRLAGIEEKLGKGMR